MSLKDIDLNSVTSFMADCKYVTVTHEGKTSLIDDTITKLEDELDDSFIRVHRKSIISKKNLAALVMDDDQNKFALMKDETRVPISRRYWKEIKSILLARKSDLVMGDTLIPRIEGMRYIVI